MKKIIASVFVITCAFLSVGNVNAAAEIKNNGAGSNNKIKVKSTSSSVVSQTNTAVFVTEVGATTNTGGNKANKNTGGTTSVTSGAALTNVGVLNTANVNTYSNSNGQCGCGCCDHIGNWNVVISGNGADSWNKVKVSENCAHAHIQSNSANIYNGVVSVTQTGGNTSSKNTNGDVTVTTGAATTTVVVENNANINTN